MGLTERYIIVAIAILVMFISFMMFMLGLFFLQHRRRAEELFLKPFPEQIRSLGFFRDVPLFGPIYYQVGKWYSRTFPQAINTDNDHWDNQVANNPAWLNQLTVKYFVLLVSGMIILYSIVTIMVSIGGIFLMLKPWIDPFTQPFLNALSN